MAAAPPSEEEVVGVLTSLRFKLTDYDVVFTNRRIIVIKIGAAPVAELAAMLDGTSGQSEARLAAGSILSSEALDRILTAHPKNFEVRYEEVSRAYFNAGINVLTMPMLTLWTRKRKVFFAFMSSSVRKDRDQVQHAKELLLKTLPQKVELKRA